MSKTKRYHDADGNKVTLTTLCKKVPDWVANQIRQINKENDELKTQIDIGVRLHQSLAEKLYAVGGNLENHKIMTKELRKENEELRNGNKHIAAWMDRCHDLEIENNELLDEIEALTECLNGSSKAVYTAEVFDKMMAKKDEEIECLKHENEQLRARIKERADLTHKYYLEQIEELKYILNDIQIVDGRLLVTEEMRKYVKPIKEIEVENE